MKICLVTFIHLRKRVNDDVLVVFLFNPLMVFFVIKHKEYWKKEYTVMNKEEGYVHLDVPLTAH